MINATQLLFHSFLEFFKLVEIVMVHVLGFVEDKRCFSSMSFLKTKLHNHLDPHLELVVVMFFQKNIYYWQLSLPGCVWFMGSKSFKVVYRIGWKGLSPYCSPFLLYILIFIKMSESKVVKNLRRTIFYTITILDSIIIIHKCDFTW